MLIVAVRRRRRGCGRVRRVTRVGMRLILVKTEESGHVLACARARRPCKPESVGRGEDECNKGRCSRPAGKLSAPRPSLGPPRAPACYRLKYVMAHCIVATPQVKSTQGDRDKNKGHERT